MCRTYYSKIKLYHAPDDSTCYWNYTYSNNTSYKTIMFYYLQLMCLMCL